MTKEQIRQETLNKRLALSEGFVREASAHIQDDVLRSPFWPKHGRVGLYSPIKNEVQTNILLQKALESGLHVYFPRVEQGIHFYEVNGLDDLERGSWNIFEPKLDCEELAEDTDLDLIIVPGVVFSKKCFRIGYGRGYYDKFFSRLDRQITSVGLGFEMQIVDAIPATEWDQPLTAVVTEKGVYRRENS